MMNPDSEMHGKCPEEDIDNVKNDYGRLEREEGQRRQNNGEEWEVNVAMETGACLILEMACHHLLGGMIVNGKVVSTGKLLVNTYDSIKGKDGESNDQPYGGKEFSFVRGRLSLHL
jgi:hypothetical protein